METLFCFFSFLVNVSVSVTARLHDGDVHILTLDGLLFNNSSLDHVGGDRGLFLASLHYQYTPV